MFPGAGKRGAEFNRRRKRQSLSCGNITDIMGNKKPVLVFLFRLHVSEESLRQYGFFQLKERFEVIGCNLGLLIDGAGPAASAPGEELLAFPSYDEFEQFVKANAAGAVFVDCIKGRTEIDPAVEKVFRLLKKYDARYVVMVGGAVPVGKSIGSKARKMISPGKFYNFAFRKLAGCLRKARIVYHFPDMLFGCDTGSLPVFCEKNGIEYVPANSWDYDRYLEYVNSPGHNRVSDGKTAVYIDEALSCALDFKINDFLKVDMTAYFKSLSGFFSVFEQRTGMRVVVAAHPKSDPEFLRNALGGRPVHTGNTVGLIADCGCVFAHWSTAVSFAVLFDKPLLLLNNNAIKATSLQFLIENMAAYLGVPSLDADDDAAIRAFDPDPAKWPRTGYGRYKADFIRHKDAPDLQSWRIMGDNIVRRYFSPETPAKDAAQI